MHIYFIMMGFECMVHALFSGHFSVIFMDIFLVWQSCIAMPHAISWIPWCSWFLKTYLVELWMPTSFRSLVRWYQENHKGWVWRWFSLGEPLTSGWRHKKASEYGEEILRHQSLYWFWWFLYLALGEITISWRWRWFSSWFLVWLCLGLTHVIRNSSLEYGTWWLGEKKELVHPNLWLGGMCLVGIRHMLICVFL